MCCVCYITRATKHIPVELFLAFSKLQRVTMCVCVCVSSQPHSDWIWESRTVRTKAMLSNVHLITAHTALFGHRLTKRYLKKKKMSLITRVTCSCMSCAVFCWTNLLVPQVNNLLQTLGSLLQIILRSMTFYLFQASRIFLRVLSNSRRKYRRKYFPSESVFDQTVLWSPSWWLKLSSGFSAQRHSWSMHILCAEKQEPSPGWHDPK